MPVVIVLIVLGLIGVWRAHSQEGSLSKAMADAALSALPAYVEESTFPFDGQREGVRVVQMRENSNMEPHAHRIEVVTPERTFVLKSLNQLRGVLQISRPALALRFVRLATDDRNYSPLPGGMEIVAFPDLLEDSRNFPWAMHTKTFRKAGFAPPSVEKHGKEYHVTRWLFLDNREDVKKRVVKVREIVGKDASYRREVLVERKPADYPDVEWFTPLPK
jgi:hypothetical protein